jgi:hypothetical protein
MSETNAAKQIPADGTNSGCVITVDNQNAKTPASAMPAAGLAHAKMEATAPLGNVHPQHNAGVPAPDILTSFFS